MLFFKDTGLPMTAFLFPLLVFAFALTILRGVLSPDSVIAKWKQAIGVSD